MAKLKSIKELEIERSAQPNFGKGISIVSGFDLGAKSPLDSRLTVKTIEERDAHVTGNRAYEGMLVYVEADKKTYQLIDNAWEEFGFNEEKFQAGIQPLVNKNTEQDNRLKSLEDLVVGGEDLESVIADVAANKAAIAKEIADRETADTVLDGKITAEVDRATAAEGALSDRLNVIEGTKDVEGSIAKALADAKADATVKSAQALTDAKAYTDAEIVKANSNVTKLEKRVKANETSLGLVDGKITTVKTETVEAAKTYTDGEITKIDTAYKAADVQVLTDAKAYADTKVSEAKTALEGRVSANEGEIADIKDLLANNNSNTIVVDTIEEIATSNPNPKVGDLAFVVSIKKAFIFKGEEARASLDIPAGWILFDEISTEVDLVDYLKKTEAEATYRKLADKIAESDLATELVTKIDAKAEKSYVDGELAKKATLEQIISAVTPVSEKANANESAIAKEVTDRQGEITRVERLITSVDGKVDGLSTSLTEKESALKAEDTKLNNRISKFVPVVAQDEPVDTEAGHVWLQLV